MNGAGGEFLTGSLRFRSLRLPLTCLVTACSLGLLAACTGPPPERPAHTAETPSVQPAASTPSPSSPTHASVSFPGASGLEASVTNEAQTSEMQTALPPQSSLAQVVDLNMKSGSFPASGAQLTFTLDQPTSADNVAFVANWDTGSQSWVPLASETSADGKSVSAKLAHFSTYGLVDWVRNGLGGLVGVRTPPPDCGRDPPPWDDKSAPQFFDDLNGPVLWCATSDRDHPDELEVKLKVNRGAAASITVAVPPVWTHSGLWETLKPETWATMVLGGPESLIPDTNTYFVPPTDEFDMRFTKSDVMNFWHSNRTRPLIQVATSPADVMAGLLYNVLYGTDPGSKALFLVTSAMAVTECSSDITTSVGDLTLTSSTVKSVIPKLGAAFGAVASCLAGQSEFVAQSAARYLATRNPGLSLEDLVIKTSFDVKKIMRWARFVEAIQVLTPVGDALTDLLLDPIARQFVFQPTDQALKEYIQGKQDFSQTFHTGYLFQGGPPALSPRRASMSLQYPRGWTTSVTRFGRPTDDFVSFSGPQGKEEVSFEFRSDAEGSCAPSNYETLEAVPLGSSGIASNGAGFHTSFVSRLYSGPYQVPAGSLPYSLPGDPSSGPPVVWNYGVDLVISGAEPDNGDPHGQACSGGSLIDVSNGVYVGVFSQHGFASEADARAFTHSDEYQMIKALLTSVKIKTWTE